MTIPAIAWLLLIGAAYLLGQYSQRHYDLRRPSVRAKLFRLLAESVEAQGCNAISTKGLRMTADASDKVEENAQ